MSSKVRIRDIARECGVSVSTVSLVLNNKPGISPDTRSRVFECAVELGYPVPLSFQEQKSNQLATIGMIVKIDPDIQPHANPFYSRVIVGIEDVCRRKGINLLFTTLPVDENNRPIDIPQMLYNNTIDGFLLVGICMNKAFTSIPGLSRVPIVLVDGYSDSGSYDAVISDNFFAAYQAVDYLIKKGHRYLGLAGSDENGYPSLKDRRNGFFRAIKDHAISDVYMSNFNLNKSHGFEEILSLLKDSPHITALFCANDDVGSAAIRAAHYLGKRIPEDISIIGYDDTYIAANTHPAMTTMHVDTVAMGRSAVHLLKLRIENPESALMTLIIHPWLVERESVTIPQLRTRMKEVDLQ